MEQCKSETPLFSWGWVVWLDGWVGILAHRHKELFLDLRVSSSLDLCVCLPVQQAQKWAVVGGQVFGFEGQKELPPHPTLEPHVAKSELFHEFHR